MPRAFIAIPAHQQISSIKAYNPFSSIASIAFLHKRFGLSYSNKYLMKETNSFYCFGSYNFSSLNIGFTADYFGNQTFGYSTQRILLAKILNNNMAIGISFSHKALFQSSGYNTIHQLTPSVGINIKPFKNISLACVLEDISRNHENEYGNNAFKIGIGYIEKMINVHLQVEKANKETGIVSLTGEYNINKQLSFLLRTATGLEPFSLGMECTLSGIQFRFLYSYHVHLGSSPECTMYKDWN